MRRYTDDVTHDIIDILQDCVLFGHSDGWSGSLEQLAERERVLKDYNVRYVDDFRGDWKVVAPRS